MINIVIPMAGLGKRFADAGYQKPKPFIDVLGKPMIEHVLENLKIPNANYIIIGRSEHLNQEQETIQKLKNKFNIAQVIGLDKTTEGTACTVLFAREQINNGYPLLIANSDQIVDIKLEAFVTDAHLRDLDGSILTFIDKELNPKWSFAKIDEKGFVTEVQEKKPISPYATVGIYYYKKGKDFVNAAIDMIIRNERVNNEFYTCPTYNYTIKSGLKIGIFNILEDQMHGTGTPEDLDKYINGLNQQ
jgi:UDP-N-acetylglucosamine diphosphorylase / glucose-1-phosphate thymidylyltransferase / UDP-N-acetylgalactosamine diphosphorylase / glucosamine-1-phosphate N-acetyltransferase / galactosamine-1-phosphate N-acetyltransferase